MGLFDRFQVPNAGGKYDVGTSYLNNMLLGNPGPQDSAGARPGYPEYHSLLDPNGNLQDPYKLKAKADVGFTSNLSDLNDRLSKIQLNTQGLEEIRKRALTAGPSEWQNLMLQKQKLEEQNAKDTAAVQQASAGSEAFSNLASKGGLSSGARERLATNNSNNLARTLQDVAKTGQGQRLDIATQDEQQKLDLLKSLPGMENQALAPEFQKTSMWSGLADAEAGRKQNLDLSNRDYASGIEQLNLKNTMGEVGRGDQFNMDKYKEQMASYAAAKQADATANSAGKGGKK